MDGWTDGLMDEQTHRQKIQTDRQTVVEINIPAVSWPQLDDNITPHTHSARLPQAAQ